MSYQPQPSWGPPQQQPPAKAKTRRIDAAGWILAVVALAVGIGLGAAINGTSAPPAADVTAVTAAGATPGTCLAALDLAEAGKVTPGSGTWNHVASDCRTKAAPAGATTTQPVEVSDPPAQKPAPEPPADKPEPAPEPAGGGEDPEVAAARGKAQDYLDFKGFCRPSLISQLEYEGYSNAAAVAAIDSLGVDWAAETVRVAQAYVDFTEFSHDGLVQQLEYEGCEPAHAEQAATQVLGF